MESEVVSVAQQIIADERCNLDEQYKPLLSNWRFDRVGVATKLILRFATWELQTYVILIHVLLSMKQLSLQRDLQKKMPINL